MGNPLYLFSHNTCVTDRLQTTNKIVQQRFDITGQRKKRNASHNALMHRSCNMKDSVIQKQSYLEINSVYFFSIKIPNRQLTEDNIPIREQMSTQTRYTTACVKLRH